MFATLFCIGTAATAIFTAEPPSTVGSRVGVEQALAEIRAAVLAGDGPRFLASVAVSDPHDSVEMRHWAEDLVKHHPFEFEASLVEDGAVFETTGARCAVTFTWRIALDQKRS